MSEKNKSSMKSVKDIVELKCEKYNIEYSGVFLGESNDGLPQSIMESIKSKMSQSNILLNYLSNENWFAISENFLSCCMGDLYREFELNKVKFCKVNIGNEYVNGRRNKSEFCFIEVGLNDGDVVSLETEANGAPFFLSDIIQIAADKNR